MFGSKWLQGLTASYGVERFACRATQDNIHYRASVNSSGKRRLACTANVVYIARAGEGSIRIFRYKKHVGADKHRSGALLGLRNYFHLNFWQVGLSTRS